MNCDDLAPVLLEFVEGDLSESQAANIRVHARNCPACAGRIRQTRDMLGALSAARDLDVAASSASERTILDAAAPVQSHTKNPLLSAPRQIGDFEVLSELGRGGMGIVYRARQVTLNRVVALKVLSPALLSAPRAATRFQTEARAAARLHHTNIVPIYAQGEHDGCLYYAMELIEGEPFSRLLETDPSGLGASLTSQPTLPDESRTARESTASRSLSRGGNRRAGGFKRIARLFAEVAEALHHAHEEGIIHRDIKPHNLMLGRDDKLHITDFGLARLLDEPGLTLSTEMVGTPAYASPEQLSSGAEIDRRTDIFSLGVTLYEALTLERPFAGKTVDQVIHAILHRDPAAPRRLNSRIPVDLETICLRAIEKDPQRRFRTAADLAADLRRYALDYPITSRRVGLLGRAARWTRRNPARASLLGGTVAVLLCTVLITQLLSAKATAAFDGALATLLTDYNDSAAARAQLDAIWWPLGDGRARDLALALASIKTQSDETLDIARRRLALNPDDRDFLYLAAWKCRRGEQWAQVRDFLTRGDAAGTRGVPVDGAGWFFRGLAIFPLSPEAAIESYNEAIRARANFTQAMIMQGRAATHLMYAFGDETHYGTARISLTCAMQLEPHNPRAAYFLAWSHIWAAETARTRGDEPLAQERLAAAFETARAAQKSADRGVATSRDVRGLNVEAHAYEHMGKYAEALLAWEHMPDIDPHTNLELAQERFAYPMRLQTWLGHPDLAEKARRGRYGADDAALDRSADADAVRDAVDAAWYEAIIASTAQSPRADAICAALSRGARAAGNHAEQQLLLAGAANLFDAPPIVVESVTTDPTASREWTPAWIRALVEYRANRLNWNDLLTAAESEARRTALEGAPKAELRRKQLLLAGAWFHRGVLELSAGRRADALISLQTAWRLNDDENYCFRARFLVGILESHPAWPPTRFASIERRSN